MLATSNALWSMSTFHRRILSAKRLELSRSLCLEEVVQYLVQESILTDTMVDKIMSKQTRFSRNVAFLTLLPARGSGAYAAFKQALHDTCQSHLANMLSEQERIYPTANSARSPNRHSGERTGDVTLPRSVDRAPAVVTAPSSLSSSANEDSHDGSSKLFVETTTLDFYCRTNINAYKMTSRCRGLALVIDVNKFQDESAFPARRGSEVDRMNLAKLFEQLSFKVSLVENVPGARMKTEMQSFAERPEHNLCDCCAVVIMSHGHEKRVYGSDGVAVDLEEIFRMFDNVNCPQLRQKPKLFLIQACRDVDKEPVSNSCFPSAAEREIHSPLSFCTSQEMLSPKVDEVCDRLPTTSDMIIGYASLPGRSAIRNTHHGSWYIQAVTRMIAQHAKQKDVAEILTYVNDFIKNKTHPADPDVIFNRRMPEFISTLCKKFYFYPGIYAKQ